MHTISHAVFCEDQHPRRTSGMGIRGVRFLRALTVLIVLIGSMSEIEAQTVVTLAWDENTEADIAGYEVSYGTQSGVYSTTVDVGNVTSQPFTVTFGVAHYFAVKAYNSSNPRQYSSYSTEVSTGATAVPVGLVATPGELSVNLSWQRPAETTLDSLQGFTVYRLDDIGQYSLVSTVAGNATFSTTLVGLNAGEKYVFSVTANDSQTGDSAYSDSASATPFAAVVAPVINWATPAAIVQGAALGAAQLNATTSVAGTFVYTPAAGTVLAVGTHVLSATFTPTNTALHTTATASVSLTVNAKFTPMIAWATPAAIVQGAALGAAQLNATASVAGTFVYTPAARTVPLAGTLTLSTTFTPTDTARYTTATASVILSVKGNRLTAVITWATPKAITLGAALGAAQLNATSNVRGTFVYTPRAGTVLAAGTHSLSVIFTPVAGSPYSAATKSVTITVNRPRPAITWRRPASIVEGTRLTSAQLNATASVPGVFVYNPKAGTILKVGTRSLSVAFTPTNTARYQSTSKSVTIVVTRR